MTARKVGTLALEYCLGLAPRSDRWLAEQELEERSREAASTAAECARLRAALEMLADTESPAMDWPRKVAKAALRDAGAIREGVKP